MMPVLFGKRRKNEPRKWGGRGKVVQTEQAAWVQTWETERLLLRALRQISEQNRRFLLIASQEMGNKHGK